MAILDTSPPPKYQSIAVRAVQLHELGLSYAAIARHLSVTGKTVAKAIAWLRESPLKEKPDQARS